MKKFSVLIAVAVLLALSTFALAETDYTVARDVFLLKARVAALEAAQALGITTNLVDGASNYFSYTDGYLSSVSPY